MSQLPIETLQVAAADNDLCNVRTLSELLDLATKYLEINTDVLENVAVGIRSTTEPGAAHRQKFWLAPTLAPFVGVFSSGAWRKVYDYPPGIAFPWVLASSPPSYLSELSTAQVSTYGLPTLGGNAKWVYHNPTSEELAT